MKTLEVYPSEKRTQFTRVKDAAGNAFLCATENIKDPKHPKREELKNCVDESRVLQPSAGG